MALIPATILTGFLGSGKTTLLKRVLTEAHGQKIAVIENEFGEENIDNDILVHDDGEQIIQMSNGCVCCTIREDLRARCSCWRPSAQGPAGLRARRSRPPAWPTRARWRRPSSWTTRSPRATCSTPSSPWWTPSTPPSSSNDRQEAQRQVGFADQIFISKTDLVGADELAALQHRLKHMNPRAPQRVVHFGEVALGEVLDLRGFNLNAKLDIDPDFLKEDEHAHHHHDHARGRALRPPSHQHEHGHAHHHHHDDDVKSFVFRSERAFDPAKLEDFLGAIVNIYGPRMLRYKGVLS
jgi:G3E family GTPase